MTTSETSQEIRPSGAGLRVLTAFAWIWVGVPFAYGLYQLIAKIPALCAG